LFVDALYSFQGALPPFSATAFVVYPIRLPLSTPFFNFFEDFFHIFFAGLKILFRRRSARFQSRIPFFYNMKGPPHLRRSLLDFG
jgi:hypothetical protein